MTKQSGTDVLSVERARSLAKQAIHDGSDWITRRLGKDGHPGTGHGHYYRLPWALALIGRRAEAASVLSWIEREALDGKGDLLPGPPRAAFQTRWSSYPLANLATGAWHLERYDVAKRIVRRLHAFQHPETGGAYAGHPDHRVDERQDLFPTAQLGMTGLTTGDADLADGAFHWFGLLYQSQPDLPNRLYSAMEGPNLIVDTGGDADLEWQVVTDFHKPRQAFYNPGIAAAFLGRYHMATRDGNALKLARAYLDLTSQGSDLQFDHTDSVQVCKFAWGSSVLLEATGDPAFLENCLRMVSWFCDAQNQDGSWDNSPFLMQKAENPEYVRMEITAEFVQHLVTLETAIGGS